MTLTAFELGGGGVLGACEAGMAVALLEHGIVSDLVVGTSIGALNGAAIAADPDGVAVHVLPTGRDEPAASGWSNLRYRDLGRIGDRGQRAHRATSDYLDSLVRA